MFPRYGWRSINALILFLGGNALLYNSILFLYRRRIKRIGMPKKICVLADVNIGDAIAMQGAISALRDFFPHTRLDYVIGRSSLPLIINNPSITHIYPLYTTAPFPSKENTRAISQLIQENNYDLIIHMSPFLSSKDIPTHIGFLGLAFFMLYQRAHKKQVHLSSSVYLFISTVLETLYTSSQKTSQKHPSLFLSKKSLLEAENILTTHTYQSPLIFFNGETISPYTRIPLTIQQTLIQELLDLPCSLLIPFHNNTDTIKNYIKTLPHKKQRKCIFLPVPMDLDVYAALMDKSDLVITGDTGPLHIAAAYKQSTDTSYSFRNSTAVCSLFGATDSSMYGYDSSRPLHTPTAQRAPSWVYTGSRRYRTLAHINKNSIYGDPALFFSDISPKTIISDIRSYLQI